MKKGTLFLLLFVCVILSYGCTRTVYVQQQPASQGYDQSLPQAQIAYQAVSHPGTYNSTRPGGARPVPGVDAIEIRPNLHNPGAQLWYHEDGRWDFQGGKFSLLFPSQAALDAYFRAVQAGQAPTPAQLRAEATRCPLKPSSVGKGQKWYSFFCCGSGSAVQSVPAYGSKQPAYPSQNYGQYPARGY